MGDPPTSRVSRALSLVILSLLTALLVEVLFESWIQELLGNRIIGANGLVIGELPTWPKQVKNGLLLTIAVASLVKVGLERRWREFRTAADVAIVALLVVLLLAGLVGDSPLTLIGEATFVYLRGAIVFYAWRAVRPDRREIRAVLTVLAAIVGLNTLVAIIQMLVGVPAFRAIGWVDLGWGNSHRAHAFLDHPNHLGHVLGLALLGMIAWMVCAPRIRKREWAAFAAMGLALSATQSRESILGVLFGAVVIYFLRRWGATRVAIACLALIALFASHLVIRPENLQELARRLRGVTDAFAVPAMTEECDPPTPECKDRTIPAREIRILYAQQGFSLWTQRPLLGYGVGQFGGFVAYQHDPNWAQDPRFGPTGFNTYGFSDITVDSFWLHLGVETGTLGAIAYIAWLFLVILPLVKATPRYRRDPEQARAPNADRDWMPTVAALWGVAAMIFAALVAFLSPALEDPLFPVLLFTVIGIAWVMIGAADNVRPAFHRLVRTGTHRKSPARAPSNSE